MHTAHPVPRLSPSIIALDGPPQMAGSQTAREDIASADAEDEFWQAVLTRDPAAEGRFWYSVSTTGVFCRPSCPSRLPRRENVAFHASPALAERAGFRPCKRCKPLQQARDVAALMMEACRLIDAAETAPSLGELANAAGLSPFHFHRLFRKTIGVTPKAYASARRAAKLREELGAGASVTQTAYDVGFNSSARFYAQTEDILGMTPSVFRKGGDGAAIRFALGTCSLGSILVAATDKGLCAIELGDEPEELLQGFQRRFPKADLVGGDPEFEALVALAILQADRPSVAQQLPLDIRGTAFQQRVWAELRAIPAGTTVTYADVARRIGKPDAVRAVAGACAANQLAIVIPCHRVVRTGGGLSGYRWGVERKRKLLDMERP